MLSRAEIQTLKGLREKKAREQAGLFVIENPKVVRELSAAGYRWAAFYHTAEWTGSRPGNAETITPEEMARVSHLPTPSEVLAVGTLVRPTLAPGELAQGLTLALDGVQDAGNVGTLVRIADWFGFARVLLSPDCADLYSQKVINASMGSFARVRVLTTVLPEVLATAQVPVFGCDLAGVPLAEVPPLATGVVVIGSEGRGLSPEVEGTLTQRITIPRFGQAESLNAAVAAGIVCAHLRR